MESAFFSFAEESKEPQNANLDEIFKCFICFNKVENAVMCPFCSKLCCSACIQVNPSLRANSVHRNGSPSSGPTVHTAAFRSE